MTSPYEPTAGGLPPVDSFWRDLLEVGEARARGMAPSSEVLQRQKQHDYEYPGVARRDSSTLGMGALIPRVTRASVGTAGLGALIPEAPATGAAWGVPVTGRPFVDAMLAAGGGVDMPATGMTFTVPSSLTAGVVAFSQTGQNFSVTESVPIAGDRTSPIVTIMTSVAVSRQAFDRGAQLDAYLTRVSTAALDAEVERQVLNGSGSNGELTGLIASASYVTLSATFAHNVVRSTLQAARLVSEAALVPARVVVMHPRRFLHVEAEALSTTNFTPAVAGSRWGEIPVVQSTGVPITVSSNQDRILALTPGESALLTLDAPRVQIAPNPLGGLGTVRIIATQYAALVVRSPTMVQCVSGTGLASPAAFA